MTKFKNFKQYLVLLAFYLAWTSRPLFSGDPFSDKVQFSFKRLGQRYQLEARFFVQGQKKVIWEVLTDYDHISRFVSSVVKSRVLEKQKDYCLVEQEASAKLLLFFDFRIQALLKIRESPMEKITFEDISRRSFKEYAGSWTIVSDSKGCWVVYSLSAIPDFFAPDFIAGEIFEGSVRGLLEEVKKEIQRRITPA